jgi:hypothetical protein
MLNFVEIIVAGREGKETTEYINVNDIKSFYEKTDDFRFQWGINAYNSSRLPGKHTVIIMKDKTQCFSELYPEEFRKKCLGIEEIKKGKTSRFDMMDIR